MTEETKPKTDQTEPFNYPMDKIFGPSIFQRFLPHIIVAFPLLVTPFLYFLGRVYSDSYHTQMGVPLGILPNDFSDILLNGFVFGILNTVNLFYPYLVYLILAVFILFSLIYILYWMPKRKKKLEGWMKTKVRSQFTSKGRKEMVDYLDSVDENINNTEILPKLWQPIDLFGFISIMIVLVSFPALITSSKAKESAQKFIASANQSNCLKTVTGDCNKFAHLTLNPKKKTSESVIKSGFIVASGPKEWAIYQPPYITGKKSGNMLIIKRDDIIEINHPVKFVIKDKADQTKATNL